MQMEEDLINLSLQRPAQSGCEGDVCSCLNSWPGPGQCQRGSDVPPLRAAAWEPVKQRQCAWEEAAEQCAAGQVRKHFGLA